MPQLYQIVRSLLKTPGTVGVAILSLALGIGANTAMFSVLNQVLLRTLPVPEPERLAFLYHPGPLQGSSSSDEGGGPSFSYPLYRELARQQTSFTGLAGARAFGASLSYANRPMMGHAHLVTGNYFQVLGVRAALGRVLEPADDVTRGGHPVAVLSHKYWSAELGASPAVLNQTIVVNGYPLTIVGVAQAGFENERQGSYPEVFVPVAMKAQITPEQNNLDNRKAHWITVFGRLKPGVSREQAQTALNVLYPAQVEEDLKVYGKVTDSFRQRLRAKRIQLKPGEHGRGSSRADAASPIYLLLGITGMVLLIACANVANLLLARGTARSREMALRLSLGATRGQLIAQLLAESWLIALVSGALGLVVAKLTLRVIVAEIPPSGGIQLTTDLDVRVLLFCLALCALTGLVFGLMPALQSTRHDLATVIKDQAGQTSGTGAASRFRGLLVSGQMAVSLVLLVTAGLFGKSLVSRMRVDLGLRADHLITFAVEPELNKYDAARTTAFYDQLEQRLAAIPGVTLVSASSVPLIAGNNWSENIRVDGFTPAHDDDTDSNLARVGAGFFRTMGIPLIGGREFTVADNAAGQKVAVVNQTFARFYFKDGQPLGRLFAEGDGKPDITIVGLVKDSKYSELDDQGRRVFYAPYRQARRPPSLYFYMRTAVEPESIGPQIRRTVASLDPNLPIADLKTMDTQIAEKLSSSRLVTKLTLSFAALAALLAGIGLYGVLAFNVARRTREIGIRMAIGATGSDVRGMVVREMAVMLVAGAVVGLGAAYAGARVLSSMLYGMSPYDVAVFAGAAGLLCGIAGVASYVPTLRATRVDPIQALRYE